MKLLYCVRRLLQGLHELMQQSLYVLRHVLLDFAINSVCFFDCSPDGHEIHFD